MGIVTNATLLEGAQLALLEVPQESQTMGEMVEMGVVRTHIIPTRVVIMEELPTTILIPEEGIQYQQQYIHSTTHLV